MNIHQNMIYKIAKLSHKSVLKKSNHNMNFKKHYKRTKLEYKHFSIKRLELSINFFKNSVNKYN